MKRLFTRKEMETFAEFMLAEKKKQVFDVIDKCKDCFKNDIEFEWLKTEMGKVFE